MLFPSAFPSLGDYCFASNVLSLYAEVHEWLQHAHQLGVNEMQ
jgi:hypothetical protein